MKKLKDRIFSLWLGNTEISIVAAKRARSSVVSRAVVDAINGNIDCPATAWINSDGSIGYHAITQAGSIKISEAET